jgi:hypothetical protein
MGTHYFNPTYDQNHAIVILYQHKRLYNAPYLCCHRILTQQYAPVLNIGVFIDLDLFWLPLNRGCQMLFCSRAHGIYLVI